MAEEQKPIESSASQDSQQLQLLLKETLKENKSLQSKNSKLESKYVELFKQNKLLKQDRVALISFTSSFLVDQKGGSLFQEPPIGQCTQSQFQNLGELKISGYIKQIQQQKGKLESIAEEVKTRVEKQANEIKSRLIKDWQGQMRNSVEQKHKEVSSLQKEIDSLRKSSQPKIKEISELKALLESRTHQLSKVSKQKLKIEHHLNNIRKKEISQELSPPEEPDQTKMWVDKNEYLALKQQVELLLAKRDELRRNLKMKEVELASQQQMGQNIHKQLVRLNTFQNQCDEKYELVRQCSMEELQNMILAYHSQCQNTQRAREAVEIGMEPPVRGEGEAVDHEEEIKREYLKNMVTRYIKAQTAGSNEQAMTLLEIIGRLVKLDEASSRNLTQYISKHKQWWYIKY